MHKIFERDRGIKMIHKSELKGKYVRHFDSQGKMRTSKVVRIQGNTLTIVNALKVKSRVHKNKVEGQEFRKRGLRPIDWSVRRR